MPKDLNYSRLLDLYGKMLTEKQSDALDFYYNEDLSLSEISENLNISRQGAMDIIHRAQNQLDALEDKLRLSELDAKLETAIEALGDIKEKETDPAKKQKLEKIIELISR